MTTPADPLSLTEGVCLGLIASGHRHGWSMVRELAPDGELGQIWSVSRPLTYRALDQLSERGLVKRTGNEPGRGRQRTLLAITPRGRRALRDWAMTPAAHLRDVRSDFLVKYELCGRLGMDRLALVDAQIEELRPIMAAIASRAPEGIVDLWRSESSSAISRVLSELSRR